MRKNLVLAFILLIFSAGEGRAQTAEFQSWIADTIQEAITRGIRPQTAYHALSDVTFDPEVVEKDQTQPEKTSTAADYWRRVVSDARLQSAQNFYNANRVMLTQIGENYGVQPRFIVALLAIESGFGELQGSYSIVQSLASLSYEGRRAEYFKNELFNALKILDRGDISLENMVGSWAGAMGWCQFMPSSFLKFAQDGDGDGRMDIWNSPADAMASAANYLRQNGWRKGEGWGRKVRLMQPVPAEYVTNKVNRPLSEWNQMGVRTVQGKKLPQNPDLPAYLVQPDGPEGDSFLAYNNFRVIMTWNRSTYFATAVGLIADTLGR
jgi:membrane-bound lytic murein transglycosylase B